LCGREFGTRALEHLSLSLCCESASGLIRSRNYRIYCDYCQPLKCWIEVSLHTARFALRSCSTSSRHQCGSTCTCIDGREVVVGYSAKHEDLAQVGSGIWCGLAQVGKGLCGFQSCVGHLVIGRSASLRLFNRRLLACILLSDLTLTQTQPPLSLSLLASV